MPGGHHIIGEKLRSGSDDARAALSRQGRYAQVTENLHVKEVKIEDAGDRFVICYNPDDIQRDKTVRQRLLTQLTEKIDGSEEPARDGKLLVSYDVNTMKTGGTYEFAVAAVSSAGIGPRSAPTSATIDVAHLRPRPG